MKIGPRYNVYLGTRQTVWSRVINGTVYVFAYSPEVTGIPALMSVMREVVDGWETVHCFTG